MPNQTVKRSDDLRSENRFRLLQILRYRGKLTRTDLARLSGLSQGSLTTMCGELTEEGIVQCTYPSQDGKAKRGRPLSNFALTPELAVCALVSITLSRITTSLIDYSGRTLTTNTAVLNQNDLTANALIDCMQTKINETMSPQHHSMLKHIAVSLQGPTNSDTGVLVRSPILPLEDLPVAKTLSALFKVPVSVNNDCNYIASALYQTKREQLGDSFAAVTVSYGVGMGMYINGSPVKGASSSALEIGHIPYQRNGAPCRCGNYGCIEAYASTYAIQRKALSSDATQSTLSHDPVDIAPLVQAATNGDKNAKTAFESAGAAIGYGVATLFTLFDPIPLALIGYSPQTWKLMEGEFFSALHEATMGRQDFTNLIHYFENAGELRLQGLAAESLNAVDREVAYRNNRTLKTTQPDKNNVCSLTPATLNSA